MDSPKAESSKVESPQVESPKVESTEVENPKADSEQSNAPLSPATATEPDAASEREELKSAVDDVEALYSADRETVTRAILRIAAAVENIIPRLPTAPPPEVAIVDNAPTVKCRAFTQRLPLQIWTSSNFLSSGGFEKTFKDVLTTFYTPGSDLFRVPNPESMVTHPSDDELAAAYSKDKWAIAPQRVFIQCGSVLNELQTITKIPLRSRPTGLIPPFKLLVHHREDIKSRLEELRRYDADDDIISDDDDKHTLAHLQYIYNFIHTDLSNYIGLDLRIRKGDIDEVLFEEAYYLFKPGDLALSASTGEDQLYRIYSVSGGRTRLSDIKRGPNNYGPPPPRWRAVGAGAGSWTDVTVIAYIMGWDGENLGPRQITHTISYFAGTRRVTDLPLYPIQFHKDPSGLRSRLRDRGKKLIGCAGHKRYTGSTVPIFAPLARFIKDRMGKKTRLRELSDAYTSSSEDEGRTKALRTTRTVRSDVYVDYKTFYSNFFATDPTISLLNAFMGEDAETSESLGNSGKTWNYGDHDVDLYLSEDFLSKHRYLTKYAKPKENLDDDEERLELLPSQVPAFVFSSRKWEWLTLDIIEDLDKSQEARHSGWNELVIPEKFSTLLLSLVSNHISGVSSRQWEATTKQGPKFQIDLVRGKGKGLIILLHGPPGSGKTSTAETIAAYTGKPLYAITCGDIGTEPRELERNLTKHTRLAEKWDCVLLLDEADVFLMSRTYDNMHRNAMVSVFLRQLEYYSGILFLTTNIVGVIDEAFKSRIHIALEYPALDEDSTLEIWTNLLQRIKRDNKTAEVKILFDEEALLQYARNHFRKHHHNGTTWNGRQIRNAFQTAIGIGQYERLKKIELAAARGEPPPKSTRSIRLSSRTFRTVAETANDFEKYITQTRGDDRERAAMHQFRRNDHSHESPPRKSYRSHGSSFRNEFDAGSSRGGRSSRMEMKEDRRYHGASSSPAPKRTPKGKEVPRRPARTSAPDSDDEDRIEQDKGRRSGTDGASDDIIEESEDDDGDEDEER